MTTPYVSLHGMILTEYVDIDGISESGGEKVISDYSLTELDFANVTENGREMVLYSFECRSSDRAIIERIVNEVNNAPVDAEFYPDSSDRCVYISYASATRASRMVHYLDGARTIEYTTKISLSGRSSRQMGGEQGSGGILRDQSLPYTTASITNNGYHETPFDYIYLRGAYDDTLDYTDNVDVVMNGKTVRVCDRLLRDDDFVLDKYGQCYHKYETDFPKTYEEMQKDVGGEDYFNLHSARSAIIEIQGMTYTHLAGGTAGNSLSVTYTDPGGVTATLVVSVSGNDITVSLGRAASAINTTNELLLAAMNVAAFSLGVQAEITGSGSTLLTANSKTYLTNGEDESVHGGSVAYEACALGPQSRFYVPFWGPLPINESPILDITLTDAFGNPQVYYAFNPDLSDAIALENTLLVGKNSFRIPDADGRSFVAIGVVTDATSSCIISAIKIEVHRYINDDDLPTAEPGDTFTISIQDGDHSNHMLNALHIVYRDEQ